MTDSPSNGGSRCFDGQEHAPGIRLGLERSEAVVSAEGLRVGVESVDDDADAADVVGDIRGR